ncbi:Uncharacterized protein dnm_057620 [Desulfonema magnum]|uniref:Uncharacterized protein n=1 Tax=Desulfonema magnum TaxID=45655 RepID=A0A975BQI2_9BACT|nr:Uncharacterized protein dnm_057620 [Desulfonema magnum]
MAFLLVEKKLPKPRRFLLPKTVIKAFVVFFDQNKMKKYLFSRCY